MLWMHGKRCVFAMAIAVVCGGLFTVPVRSEEKSAVAEQALAEWLERFGEDAYRIDRDSNRRIIYATSKHTLSESGHREMRVMLDELADHLSDTLFGAPPEYEVLVAIASPREVRQLFRQHNVGGSYVHRLRRLVSRDTGGSLRHEYFHVMHYGHMERLGQPHALWVQEGIASLYEDYELTERGIVFLPNDRNDITRNRARINRLIPWESVFELPSDRFMARATVLYPQARSMFEFVAARGKLQTWYEAYVAHFDEDTTGKRAFEIAFEMDVREVERSWREWVLEQPITRAGNEIAAGQPSLGVGTASVGVNDGVLITQVLPGSTASLGDVRVGDVVVSVGGHPTYTMTDVRRAISDKVVGDEIQIRVRRGEGYETIPLRLKALGGH